MLLRRFGLAGAGSPGLIDTKDRNRDEVWQRRRRAKLIAA